MRYLFIRLLFRLLDPKSNIEVKDEIIQKWLQDQWTHPAFQMYIQISVKRFNKELSSMITLDKDKYNGISAQKFENLRLAQLAKMAYQRKKK